MSKIDLNIPALSGKFFDLRELIPGDSFNWSWVRSLSDVNYLAIHHSAGSDNQTPEEISNYHINNNGWGGIGYHFLISKDGTVYYVGDISTARANVANLNEQVIGICLIGNFTQGKVPTDEQYLSAHSLCDFFISNYPDLTNLKSWDVVVGHRELPGQTSICPGEDWLSWKKRIVSPVQTNIDRSPLGTVTFNPLKTTNEAIFLQGQVSRFQETINHQKSQIDNLQASLAAVNRQLITLKEALSQKDSVPTQVREASVNVELESKKEDQTLTLLQGFYNLYKFIFEKGVK